MHDRPIPEQIIYVAKRMFERRLTDMAGGNISARAGEQLYITPFGNRLPNLTFELET